MLGQYKGPNHNCGDCKNRLWLTNSGDYCRVTKIDGKWTNTDKIFGTCKCEFTNKTVLDSFHTTEDFQFNCDKYECDDISKLKYDK